MSGAGARRSARLVDLHPPASSLCSDVKQRLTTRPALLPPKYFYDAAGALLFERITALDEYYPTRTEIGILERNIGEIADGIGPGASIVEFGSGSGLKTRILLRHLAEPASYIPIDISRAQLTEYADSIATEFPRLEVVAICADYTRDLTLPLDVDSRPLITGNVVAFFPGSTIGNFEADEAAAFLTRVTAMPGERVQMLIGVDLHKDREILERAYNDAHGVTAAFNLNVLERINRECGADFDRAAFRHVAWYDESRHRIEMRLVCERVTTATIPGDDESGPTVFHFAPGDHITTEYSHKYTLEEFETLARRTGWRVEAVWTDQHKWFGVWLLCRA